MSDRKEDFQNRVYNIVGSSDREMAHVDDFELRAEFLELLATGNVTDLAEIRDLAKILIQTENITRWFA